MKTVSLSRNGIKGRLHDEVFGHPIFDRVVTKDPLAFEYWRLSRLRYGVLGPSLANQLVADVREG